MTSPKTFDLSTVLFGCKVVVEGSHSARVELGQASKRGLGGAVMGIGLAKSRK